MQESAGQWLAGGYSQPYFESTRWLFRTWARCQTDHAVSRC